MNIKHAHVIGHSVGGKTAAALALSNPKRIRSLAILDISPVEYSENELSFVVDTVNFLQKSQNDLSHAKNKKDLEKIFCKLTKDTALQAFLSSNLQLTECDDGSKGYIWKYNVDALVDGVINVLDFPVENQVYIGPTLVVKAENSNFVRTKHVDRIKSLFPNYRLATVRKCGHWLHAEKPLETANILCQFIEYAASTSISDSVDSTYTL